MVVGTLRGMPYRVASSVVAPDRRLTPGVFRSSHLGVWLGLALSLGLVAGCGQRGPLVLPGAAHGASSPAAQASAASTPPPAVR
jgi:predicted small lipoprotein YifL